MEAVPEKPGSALNTIGSSILRGTQRLGDSLQEGASLSDMDAKPHNTGPVGPPLSGPGDIIKEKYDAMFSGAFAWLWEKAQQLTSGLSTGAILSGIGIVAVIAMFGGYLGANEALSVGPIPELARHIVTFEDGVVEGLSAAFHFLISAPGLLTLAGSSVVLASVIHKNKPTPELSLEEAQQRSKQYEAARQQQPAQEKAPVQERPQPEAPRSYDDRPRQETKSWEPPAFDPAERNQPAPEKNFCANENIRRAATRNEQTPGIA